MKILCSLLISLLAQGLAAQDTLLLFYLGGQSNMDGYGYLRELPDHLDQTFSDVWIFHGNSTPDGTPGGGKGIWAPLKPGHGAGFTSDGETNRYSDRFGLELSFAHRMQELYPGKKIALIKYARGGSSIDSLAAAAFGAWEPDFRSRKGINQYDHFLATLRNAYRDRDVNGDGRADVLVPSGILWMQGESDGDKTEEIAQRYYANLKRLMDLIRAALHSDDLPVLIGKISDSYNGPNGKVWPYGELVQYAQERYARDDPRAAIIRSTRHYGYSDPYHYDGAGYIDMGIRFAEGIQILLSRQ